MSVDAPPAIEAGMAGYPRWDLLLWLPLPLRQTAAPSRWLVIPPVRTEAHRPRGWSRGGDTAAPVTPSDW